MAVGAWSSGRGGQRGSGASWRWSNPPPPPDPLPGFVSSLRPALQPPALLSPGTLLVLPITPGVGRRRWWLAGLGEMRAAAPWCCPGPCALRRPSLIPTVSTGCSCRDARSTKRLQWQNRRQTLVRKKHQHQVLLTYVCGGDHSISSCVSENWTMDTQAIINQAKLTARKFKGGVCFSYLLAGIG